MRAKDSVEFRILGPLEVVSGPERLDLGGARQQVVMAMLLLSANNVVSLGRLEQAIYGDELPPTSRSQAQMAVSALRRLLAAHGQAGVIARRAHGYALQVDADRLDSRRFAELVAAARTARATADLERAVAKYRDALQLWRGPALEGLDSLLVRAAAVGLDEQLITVTEERIGLELELGRHHELVGELTVLTGEFPLRERLRGQLMLALYRCGRTAEALRVYQHTRSGMIGELGIEPSAELQQLQHAILNTDPELDLAAGPVARRPLPALLPADIADFTDRSEPVRQIRQRLTQEAGPRLAAPVVVITGPGGVGKTSLAVHVSHLLALAFGDGQLFADLHAAAAHPVVPAQVLERFLRALGVPGPQIPPGLDERAEAYRNLLAGRRTLVVLDDAGQESQVLPLLPGSRTAGVLITSRARLTGLPGAVQVDLQVLSAGQSLDLLGHIVGAGRVQAQPQAAAAVAEQCGHLPLAVRIAGARLAARPHWGIQQLADRLVGQTNLLDELEHGEMGVRASIWVGYQGVSDQGRRLLRRLGLLEVPVFSGWLAAPLLDQPLASAEDTLDELVSARLVESVGSGSGVLCQYRSHELIRVFARERLAAEEPAAEQASALQRALGALLWLAEEANRRVEGHDGIPRDPGALRWPLPGSVAGQLVGDALAWYERERAGLVSGVRQAARAGLAGLCWSLALSAETLFQSSSYKDDWRDVTDIGLRAARQAGDVRGEAAMLNSTGLLHQELGELALARRQYEMADRLFRDAGDDYGVALAMRNIAFIDRVYGHLGEAAARYEQALATFRATPDSVAVAYVLHSLARVKLESGELGAARELLTEALRLAQGSGAARVVAQVLYATGEVDLEDGALADAAEAFAKALATVRDLADRIGEAYVLRGAGVTALRQGDLDGARSALESALELASAGGIPVAAARALLGLSELALASGDPERAVGAAQQAAEAFRQMQMPLEEARAVTLLGQARTAHIGAAAVPEGD